MYWAVTLEPPFGGSNEWVGWLNFDTVFSDPKYWNSVRVSLFFAAAATATSLTIAVLLAMFVDRRLTGHQVYKFTFFLALCAGGTGSRPRLPLHLLTRRRFHLGDQPRLPRPVEPGAPRAMTR